MTDLEITKLCAGAMGIDALALEQGTLPYDPLHDDAQAMALVKKFQIVIERDPKRSDYFGVTLFPPRFDGRNQQTQVVRNAPDLNRAICECVAKMQEAK